LLEECSDRSQRTDQRLSMAPSPRFLHRTRNSLLRTSCSSWCFLSLLSCCFASVTERCRVPFMDARCELQSTSQLWKIAQITRWCAEKCGRSRDLTYFECDRTKTMYSAFYGCEMRVSQLTKKYPKRSFRILF
jgi:hypothetical protein